MLVNTARSRSVKVSGSKINIREWGTEEKTVCLLIHGLADGSFVWEDFANRISSHCHVLAPDLRGHGDSDGTLPNEYTIETYAADIQSIIRQMSLTNCILVGHSLGGDVVAKMLSDQIEGCIGAAFVDAGPASEDNVRLYLYQQIAEGYRTYESIKAYVDWLSQKRLLADINVLERQAISSMRQIENGYQPKFDLNVANILLEEVDDSWWWLALKKCKFPTLVIRGMGSAVLSQQDAEKMVAILENGSMASVKGAGHAVMTDNPVGFYEAMAPFLRPLLGT